MSNNESSPKAIDTPEAELIETPVTVLADAKR